MPSDKFSDETPQLRSELQTLRRLSGLPRTASAAERPCLLRPGRGRRRLSRPLCRAPNPHVGLGRRQLPGARRYRGTRRRQAARPRRRRPLRRYRLPHLGPPARHELPQPAHGRYRRPRIRRIRTRTRAGLPAPRPPALRSVPGRRLLVRRRAGRVRRSRCGAKPGQHAAESLRLASPEPRRRQDRRRPVHQHHPPPGRRVEAGRAAREPSAQKGRPRHSGTHRTLCRAAPALPASPTSGKLSRCTAAACPPPKRTTST